MYPAASNVLRQTLKSAMFRNGRLHSTTTSATVDANKLYVHDLSKFERKIMKWFGTGNASASSQIPIRVLEKAKSKFWITVNVGTIILSSALVGVSVYRYRHNFVE